MPHGARGTGRRVRSFDSGREPDRASGLEHGGFLLSFACDVNFGVVPVVNASDDWVCVWMCFMSGHLGITCEKTGRKEASGAPLSRLAGTHYLTWNASQVVFVGGSRCG